MSELSDKPQDSGARTEAKVDILIELVSALIAIEADKSRLRFKETIYRGLCDEERKLLYTGGPSL